MATAPLPQQPRRNVVEIRSRAAEAREREIERKRKIDRAAAIMDRLDVRNATIDEAIKALQVSKKLNCRRFERIETQVLELMTKAQFSKLEGITRSFATRPAPLALQVIDDSLIPAEYLRVKYEADKVSIKNALLTGEAIEGVKLTQKICLVRK